jgi:hypothetical protein
MKQTRGCGKEVKQRMKRTVKQGERVMHMKLLNEKKRVQLTPRCIRGRIVTMSLIVKGKFQRG